MPGTATPMTRRGAGDGRKCTGREKCDAGRTSAAGVLADQGDAVAILERAVQLVPLAEHRVVDEDLDVLGQAPAGLLPQGLVEPREPAAQLAQDLTDRRPDRSGLLEESAPRP